jgi:nucleotidyltransferase substrate binding protein (TIGR01987 family)
MNSKNMEEDIRWEQRFSNFVKELNKLEQSVDYINQLIQANSPIENEVVLSELIKEGLIQRFEYTHELAWNVMKDYAFFQGNSQVGGSRDAIREAFQLNLITKGEIWMEMIGSRNKTSHTYNESIANEIYNKILNEYYFAFVDFKFVMKEKLSKDQSNLFN